MTTMTTATDSSKICAGCVCTIHEGEEFSTIEGTHYCDVCTEDNVHEHRKADPVRYADIDAADRESFKRGKVRLQQLLNALNAETVASEAAELADELEQCAARVSYYATRLAE